MQYSQLSDSDIEVSELTLGLWNFSGDSTWGEQDEEEAIETIQTAIDLGVTTFDNAEAYGDGYAEQLLGKALTEYDREDVTICTKAGSDNLGYEDLKAACEASLDRMQTEYVDVYYLHWPNPDIPIAESLRALEDLKAEGKIREVAVSNFGSHDLSELFEVAREENIDAEPAMNQLPYNLLWRAIEYDIVPICEKYDVGITSYSSLLHGILTGKFNSPDDVPEGRSRTRHFSSDREGPRHDEPGAEELTFETLEEIERIADDAGLGMTETSIAWNLAQPQIKSVIVGARSPEQIRQNAAAANVELSAEVRDRLDEATQDLKEQLGANPDMWQSDSRYN